MNRFSAESEKFKRFVCISTKAMLRLAQDTENLSADQRIQILHILNYALDTQAGWHHTRELLLELAPKLERAGIRQEWIPFLKRGISRCGQESETAHQAELELFLGILYRLLGKWSESRTFLDYSVQHFKEVKDEDGQARALNRLSFLARLEGKHGEANKLINKAFLLCQEESQTKALCHTTAGVLYLDQHKLSAAQHHFEEALRLHKHFGDRRLIAWAYSDLGVCQWQQEHFRDAITSYNTAMSGFENVNDVVQLAVTQMHLGLSYADLGEYKKALNYYDQAENVFHRVHDNLRLAMTYNNRGLVYSHVDEWEKADNAYRASLENYQQLNRIYSAADVLNNWGTSYSDRGDHGRATEIFTRALNLLDMLDDLPDGDDLRNEVIQKMERLESM